MSQDFFDRLQTQLRTGALKETIEQLVAFLHGNNQEHHSEAVLHAFKLNKLLKQERCGLLSQSQAQVENNILASQVLEFIDVLAGEIGQDQRPSPSQPLKVPAPPEMSFEKIIGNNRLKRISWLAQGLFAARSVCRVLAPVGLGSGFMVGPGLLLTNHHVLPTKEEASRAQIEFNFQDDFQGNILETTRYGVQTGTFATWKDLDVSLVALQPRRGVPPPDHWGHLPLARDSAPALGDHVSIIQHPSGGLKQIALSANQVLNVFEHRLQYTTDTMPGSSGSPVLNDDWQVTALHHAGGNLIKDQAGNRIYANQGILIGHILARTDLASRLGG